MALNTTEGKCSVLEKQLKVNQDGLTKCKLSLKRTRAREEYARQKIIKLEEKTSHDIHVHDNKVDKDEIIKDLRKQLNEKSKTI